MTQKESAQKETLAVSATMKTNVENRRAHPLLLQNRRRKAMGKILQKGKSLRGQSPLGRDIEDLANGTSVGNASTPRVIHGILPCVRITKPNRAANSVNSALLCTERMTVSQTNDQKKNGGNRRIPGKQVACARTLSRRNPIRFYGRAQNSRDQNAACKSQRVHYAT